MMHIFEIVQGLFAIAGFMVLIEWFVASIRKGWKGK